MTLDPYAITLAVLAPTFDLGTGLVGKRFWRRQMVLYNDQQLAENQVKYFLDRAAIIASHVSFVAWWPMSIIGTVIRAYPVKGVMVTLVVTLVTLIVAWMYSISLEFGDVSTGRDRYVLGVCRTLGYAVSLTLAVVVGGAG